MYKIVLLFTVLSLVLAACSSDDDDDVSGGDQAGSGVSASGTETTGDTAGTSTSTSTASEMAGDDEVGNTPAGGTTILEGTWVKACGAVPGEDSMSDVVTMTFSGSSLASRVENYTDSDCLTPFAGAPVFTASGTFIVGDEVTTTGGVQANTLDTSIDMIDGAPFDEREFDIFIIQTDTLFFGIDEGGETAENRPDTLNFDRGFERQ